MKCSKRPPPKWRSTQKWNHHLQSGLLKVSNVIYCQPITKNLENCQAISKSTFEKSETSVCSSEDKKIPVKAFLLSWTFFNRTFLINIFQQKFEHFPPKPKCEAHEANFSLKNWKFEHFPPKPKREAHEAHFLISKSFDLGHQIPPKCEAHCF